MEATSHRDLNFILHENRITLLIFPGYRAFQHLNKTLFHQIFIIFYFTCPCEV